MERTQNEGDSYSYKFGNVRIFKNQELGHGSYGAVYKAKCDALPCAAKLIYPVLFGSNTSTQPVSPQRKEHRLPMRRFEAECHFLSQIKHPNIVQYLGMYHDPETAAPVLLMELMDESLTHFLETAQNPIPFHVQVNILHDTMLALAFLHTNGTTHRDLSSNNVLLIAGSRAKITDFGMSKFADAAAPHLTTMTQCPGTQAYMPPEALKKPPKYSEKLDCFSFGVLTVQVITREFPAPADQLQATEMLDSEMKKVQVFVQIPELERRQSHISLIPAAHPLQPIALNCLKDNDVERPTALQLCETLQQLKTTPVYGASIQQAKDKDLLIKTQGETIQDKEGQLQNQQQTIQNLQQQLHTLEQENQQLKLDVQAKLQEIQQLQCERLPTVQQLQQMKRLQQEVIHRLHQRVRSLSEPLATEENNKQNHQLPTQQQLERKVQQLKQQVRSSEELVAEFQQGMMDKDRQIEQLQTQLQQQELKSYPQPQAQQQPVVRKKTASRKIKLSWKRGPKVPTTMIRGSSTTIGNTIFVNDYDSPHIYAFHNNTMEWSTLPKCPFSDSTLTTINNKLTTIGGRTPTDDAHLPTDKVITYHNQKWMELHPPMPTEKDRATVLSTTTHVIVIGGMNSAVRVGTTEIFNIETGQWSIACPLPYRISRATIALLGETLYMLGGETDFVEKDFSVVSCQLKNLLDHSTTIHSTQGQASSLKSTHTKVWHSIPDLPVRFSTCVIAQGHVLAIGGEDKQGMSSSAIYRYNQQSSQWTVVGRNMITAKSVCLATILPDNKLIVLGGMIGGDKETDETEISNF